MRQATYAFIFIVLNACGPMDVVSLSSLTDKQPKVVSVKPEDGVSSYDGLIVEVNFSTPIDPKTITSKSFLVTSVAEGEIDPKTLWKQVLDNKLVAVEGSYEALNENRTVRFVASKPFPTAVRCGILVTPQVLSPERLPLNQTPGEGPTPFFSSFYAQGDGKVTAESNVSPPTLFALERPSHLQLNEIFYDAVGSDTEGNLFIELLGEPEKSIVDYQIIMVNGAGGKIVDSIKIPMGMQTNKDGFFVIADAITNQPGVTKVLNAHWVTNFDPPNGPDCIQLIDPEGKLVDVVGYGSPLVLRAENNLFCYQGTPAPDAPSGSSLVRTPQVPDTNDNNKDWSVDSTPKPGE